MHLDIKKIFHINTDASNYGFSAVLCQDKDREQQDLEKPPRDTLLVLSTWSKMMNDAQKKYPNIKKEC